jgi:hypothetical protein
MAFGPPPFPLRGAIEMAAATQLPTITHLQDLFYRSKFNQILTELTAREEELGSLDAELTLLKANTLFELHDVAEAKVVLKNLSQGKDGFDEAYLYALARLAYLDDKAGDARPIFREIYEKSRSPNYRFKALLGIANTHWTEGDHGKLPPLIEELHSFEPLPRDDERISLMIFLGNFYLDAGSSPELAKQYFKKALSSSAANTWTFFITRSLHGLARACEATQSVPELNWTLELLQAFVDQSEQRYFSYVVNEKFKNHFAIATPMEFDTANHRLFIENRWIPFHDKPLLFQFLLLLHDRGSFVDKEAIARGLWPIEEYKPRVHDPRIFDIAKRARHLIEAYENQPVVLLSGRMGYKLAST